jgi:hypothetical protein
VAFNPTGTLIASNSGRADVAPSKPIAASTAGANSRRWE